MTTMYEILLGTSPGIEVQHLPPLYLRALLYATGLTPHDIPPMAVQDNIAALSIKRAEMDDDITDDEMAIRLMQFLPADLWPQRGEEMAVDLES